MNSNFYVGVVESRADPLKLGRFQVRVFGVHSELLTDVPTSDLPWAISLVQSPSLSGIGKSSAGYIEGTMVFVFFQDGESKQSPVIMGALHGVPISKSSFTGQQNTERFDSVYIQTGIESTGNQSSVLSTSSDTTLDTAGRDVANDQVASNTVVGDSYRSALKAVLGEKESNNNYFAVNQLNYIGKYQMGAAMLTDLGYVKKGTKNRDLDNPDSWTGKNGVTSKDSFLSNSSEQEVAMDSELVLNEKRLRRMGVIDETSTSQEISGYMATSHLLGTGGARDMKRGVVKSDANGVTGNTYYKLGFHAVAGVNPVIAPDNVDITNTFRTPSRVGGVGVVQTSVSNNKGSFGDPNGIYPRYLNEQDTNRLARNQNISKTIVPIKDASRDLSVKIANSGSTWDQPQIPFNPEYPFNNVFESESGHIIEIDDTPNNERLHQFHSSGTFTEIDRNGTNVRKIVGDTYEIWERNGYVHIKGAVNITVEGNANINVANNCELEVNGDFNTKVGGNVNWSVGGDWNLKVEGKESHTNGGDFAVDAFKIHLNSGESAAGGISMTSKSSGAVEFPELILEPRNFEELTEFETDDATQLEVAEYRQKLQDSGLLDDNIIDGVIGEAVKPSITATDVETVSCDMFRRGDININQYISNNYKLSDFTKGRQIPLEQSGLKDVEIACNLKSLAVNVMEIVKNKYPGVKITSGLRSPSTKTSQHPLGMAVDLQFSGYKSADYLAIASDLSSILPFDQLILEYASDNRVNGAPTTWIHISHTRAGNRKQIFTMNNHKRISDFGELKAVA